MEKRYRNVKQECEACGKEFMLRYCSDGTYEYVGESCDCEADFYPVDEKPSISEWIAYLGVKERLIAKMEELGWSIDVSACEDKDREEWELGKYSPAGEDFYISFTTDLDDPYDVEREVRAWHCGFDPEEHAAMWLEARIRNSCAGVPDMFTLVHDAEAIDEMLDELSDAVTEIVRGKPETIQETFAKSFALRPMLEEAMKDIPMSQRMHPVNWEKACAVLSDYHGSKGSVMDFTEDDWKVWQKYQGHPFDPEETVDDVCIICDEPHMSPIIEFEACVAKACYRWHEDMTAYHQTDAERDAGLPPIEYIQDCVANIYKWRMELLTKAIAAIKEQMREV